MRRRDYLRTSAFVASLSAGCLGYLDSTVTLPESATLTGWPMYGANPAHTGAVTDDPPALSEPTRRWEHATPSTPVTPPVVGGDIIIVGTGGNEIRAIERTTGELVWKADAGVAVSPVVQDGIVYAGSSDTEFVALDARTGDELWRYEFSRADRAEWGKVVNTPAVTGNTVMISIAGVTDTLHAADVEDGSKRWSADPPGTATQAVVAGDRVHDYGTVLDLASGETVRQYSVENQDVAVAPAVTDDAIFVRDGYERLVRYSLDSTTLEWEATPSRLPVAAPVVAGDTVLVSGIAFDASTGAKRFELPTGTSTMAAVTDGLGVFMRRDSLVAFDPTDGTVLWEEETAPLRPHPEQPAIGDSGVYVSTGDGVVAFE